MSFEQSVIFLYPSLSPKKIHVERALPFPPTSTLRDRVLFILDATVFNIIAHTGGQTIICARGGFV